MAKEKRTAVLYMRVKPANKKWFFRHMENEGYESMSLWMDGLIDDMKDHINEKEAPKKKVRKNLH